MKFTVSLALAPLFAVSALAQNIAIGAPQPGATFAPGQSITVEVNKPDVLTGSQDVSLVLSFLSCGSGSCPSPQDRLGQILYSGPFNPQFSSDGSYSPHQNFTVQIPSGAPSGPAVIDAVHFNLIGAGPYPALDFQSVSINITA